MSVFKYKTIWVIVGVALGLIILSFYVGNSVATVNINDKKADYESVVSHLEDSTTDLEDVEDKIISKESEIAEVDETLENKKEDIEEALDLVNDREQLEDDIEA